MAVGTQKKDGGEHAKCRSMASSSRPEPGPGAPADDAHPRARGSTGLDRNVACAVVTTEGYLVAGELVNPENKERMAAAVMGLCAQARELASVWRRRGRWSAGATGSRRPSTDERPRRRWFRGARVVPAC